MKCTCTGESNYNCIKHGLTSRAIKYRRWRSVKIVGAILGTLLAFRIAYVAGLNITADHKPHVKIVHFRVMSALPDCDLMVRDVTDNRIGQLTTGTYDCPKWEEGDPIDMEFWPSPTHGFYYKYDDGGIEEKSIYYHELGFGHEFTDGYDD